MITSIKGDNLALVKSWQGKESTKLNIINNDDQNEADYMEFIAPLRMIATSEIKSNKIENKKIEKNEGINSNKGILKKESKFLLLNKMTNVANNNYKETKSVRFRNIKLHKAPLEEIINVPSYRKANLENTYLGIKNTEEKKFKSISCGCQIY